MLLKHLFKILIIGEDYDLKNLLNYSLNPDEFICSSVSNGNEGLQIIKEQFPNMIILDIILSDIDSIELCEKIREIPEMKNSIIIFLSSRHEDYNQISAFNAGADDFMKKPISPKVFITKIKVLINKYKKLNPDNIEIKHEMHTIEMKNLIIYSDSYSILKDNKRIQLPKKEFDLLLLLAANKNKVVSRDEIYNTLWGDKSQVLDRTIDVHLRKLRKKIGNAHIITLKKLGYRFIDV